MYHRVPNASKSMHTNDFFKSANGSAKIKTV